MEHIVNLHIEKLPEGVYLATSDDVQGLVAQGRTIAETIEIARDIARKLAEAQGKDAVQIALIEELDGSRLELTDEQLAEVRSRRADTNSTLLTLEEFDARPNRFGL